MQFSPEKCTHIRIGATPRLKRETFNSFHGPKPEAGQLQIPAQGRIQDFWKHFGHTNTAIWVSSLIAVLRLLSHHVQFLHLFTDERPKMLAWVPIDVCYQIHIVSLSFKIICKL